jgi:bacterial/archaeal transporter family-2 protein
MSTLFSVMLALLAGVSIVISRSINALLAEKIGTLSGSFFNYATGLIASVVFLLLFGLSTLSSVSLLQDSGNMILLLGGVIGVINIILLNRIVSLIPPLQLTLIVFTAQLASGMLLDYFLLDLFSIRKLIGCSIVIIGLLIHTYAQGKPAA